MLSFWFDMIWYHLTIQFCGYHYVGIQIRYLSTSYTLRIQPPPKKCGVPTNRVYSVHPLTSCEMPWKSNLHRELMSWPCNLFQKLTSYTTPIRLCWIWDGMGPAYGVQRSERNPQLRLHLRCCIGNSPFAARSAVRRKKGRSIQRGFARSFPAGKAVEKRLKRR